MLEPHNAIHNEGREKSKFEYQAENPSKHITQWWQVAATSSCQRGLDAYCARYKKRLPTSHACLGRLDSGCAVLRKNHEIEWNSHSKINRPPGGQAIRQVSKPLTKSKTKTFVWWFLEDAMVELALLNAGVVAHWLLEHTDLHPSNHI